MVQLKHYIFGHNVSVLIINIKSFRPLDQNSIMLSRPKEAVDWMDSLDVSLTLQILLESAIQTCVSVDIRKKAMGSLGTQISVGTYLVLQMTTCVSFPF